MRSLGAELIEHGRDFDEAKEQAARIATQRNLEFAPSFHRDFVIGVATYAFELLTARMDLDVVYVPIGLGSGICGVMGTSCLVAPCDPNCTLSRGDAGLMLSGHSATAVKSSNELVVP